MLFKCSENLSEKVDSTFISKKPLIFMEDLFPREKLIKYGLRSLTNPELLSIILEGNQEDCTYISKDICQRYNLEKIQKMSPSRLKKDFNLSIKNSCKIIAALELGERSRIKKDIKKSIRCAEDVSKILLPQVQSLNQEYLFVVFLDTRKKIISEETLFIGSLTESLVCPREIFKRGLEINASGIILAHNHPSGNPTPSEADIKVTKEMVEIGRLMGIEVLDHIVLGKKDYWSLAENGLM